VDVNGPLAAIMTALGICVVNTALGYVVSRIAFGKELNVFLALVFGSLGVRAIVVMVAAWFCLSVVSMHQVAFSLTFAIACFVLLLGEILFFHRSFETAKRRKRRPVTDLLKKKTSDLTFAIASL
jgi:zinc transporter ZupT